MANKTLAFKFVHPVKNAFFVYESHNYTAITFTEVECSDLPSLAHGVINYSNGTNNSRPVGTVANYSCGIGYSLNGTDTKFCEYYGNWSYPGEPMCDGM